MSKRQAISEERRRLEGFVLTVYGFMRRQFSAAGPQMADLDPDSFRHAPLVGLRMAAADMVEWCQDVSVEQLARLDGDLGSRGLPTLTQLRDRNYRQALGILARGVVRNEAEWQVLNGLVANTADTLFSPLERDQAERLVAGYRRRSSGTE